MLNRSTALVLLSLIAGASAAADRQPVMIELFTSQGCYSCPPAEKLLGSMLKRRGHEIIALEFHVDYWNDLVWGLSGKWADPHSSAEYTKRQRRYASTSLKGRGGVYTPQMVVGGQYAAVGSDSGAIDRQIKELRRDPAPVKVTTSLNDAGLQVVVDGDAPSGTPVWLASYLRKATTEVTGGENDGKTLDNHHVVTELRKIGVIRNGSFTAVVPDVELDGNRGCAVFVQRASLGRVYGAGNCPKA